MLCLSGFELYSRWVPLLLLTKVSKATLVLIEKDDVNDVKCKYLVAHDIYY